MALLGVWFQVSAATAPAPPLLNRAAVFDFDGDRKSDYAVVRFEQDQAGFKMVWYIWGSSTGIIAAQWGQSGMQMAPADYDGDGKWDIAVWAPPSGAGSQAYFYILRSSNRTLQIVPLGTTDDSPFETQDFDGDGKADPTVTHCTSSTGDIIWTSRLSRTGELRTVQFGRCEQDRRIRGDFDGDGKADIAVYRIDDGQNQFIILQSSNNIVRYVPFGVGNDDRVVPVDFDGDGKSDPCVIRVVGDSANWYWIESSTGQARGRQFGILGANFSDNAVPGDYDGDGKTDFAVWRKFNSQPAYFFIDESRVGFAVFQWGRSSLENPPAGTVQFR